MLFVCSESESGSSTIVRVCLSVAFLLGMCLDVLIRLLLALARAWPSGLKPVACVPAADYEAIIKLCDGFNGADLRNVCTEAGQSSARRASLQAWLRELWSRIRMSSL